MKLVFGKRLIGITVKPLLTAFTGSDDRMPGSVRMFGSMSIWRTVATPGPATLLARPQMHPRGSDLHTLFANALVRQFDVGDAVDVRADFPGHDKVTPVYRLFTKNNL